MENDESETMAADGQDPKKKELFEDAALPAGNIDLQDDIESNDEGLPPPEEENEAREINLGSVVAAVLIFIVIVVMVATFTGGKRNKKIGNELDKAGSKYEVDFKEKAPETVEETFESAEKPHETEKNVDDVLDTLPSDLRLQQGQPGPAPVAPVGSGGYSKSERPDTRNSKSPRKIEGLKGQAPVDTNSNIVNAVMNGNYTPNAARTQLPSKEEYLAQMMERTKQLQGQLYGAGASGSQAGAYQQNRENFYSNGTGSGGSGEFMAYNTLWDGTIISGVLVTAINTDNPGVVIARVTENVYSSYDSSMLLIPEGSLLYATYNSSISYGQNRIQVAWNLLIRPDGYRIVLGNMNGVDSRGASGYKGFVNNHPWETLKALGIIAVFSILNTEITNDIAKSNNQYMQNVLTDTYSQGKKIGDKIIDRALDIKPTITIKAGKEIKLITNTPLELPPVQLSQVTRKYIRTR